VLDEKNPGKNRLEAQKGLYENHKVQIMQQPGSIETEGAFDPST
jgi:hypothetical protein